MNQACLVASRLEAIASPPIISDANSWAPKVFMDFHVEHIQNDQLLLLLLLLFFF